MEMTATDVGLVRVREIAREDAAAVAELSGQLGYEISAAQVEEQIRRLVASKEAQIAFVACMGAEVVGWIEAAITYHLQTSPYSLISGLVVRDGVRSLGVGRMLCAEVEAWSRAKGITMVRVTSRMTREGAHRFYLRDGFKQIKTSAMFEKVLR